MTDMKHAKGFPHDPETGMPLAQWTGEEITTEEHIAAGNLFAVDPEVDASLGANLGFPLNPPEIPTHEAVEEVYGLAVIRDIPFSTWHGDPMVRGLVERLAGHRDIPMMDGVRQDTGDWKGIMPGQDLQQPGPFVSQFLMGSIQEGPYHVSRTVHPQPDYGTTVAEAALMESGGKPDTKRPPLAEHLSHSPRTLARAVENDFPGQHWIHAWLKLMGEYGMRAQGHADEHYTQIDWCEGGIGNLIHHLYGCIDKAMNVTWKAGKWRHKHIRPAAFGLYLENSRPDDPVMRQYADLEYVKTLRQRMGNFLLPVASRNGHPGHPEYVTGHDTCEGVGSTLTRAFFDPEDNTPWPDHVVQGLTDPAGVMTISSEALKMADNLGAARRKLGVHWFYSSIAGRAVGERVTLDYLEANGLNVPTPVWIPLWEETVERLQLPTDIPAAALTSTDEEE